MKFFKYWAQGEATANLEGRPWKVRAYGGSNSGIDDARKRGQESAVRAAAAVERGQPPGAYGYFDRPLREEIVQEISDGDGTPAVISRNSYGSLVLNTSRVMFVDVDDASASGVSLGDAFRSVWAALQGKQPTTSAEHDSRLLGRFEEVVRSRRGMGLRVYRTAAGYRLLVTSGTFDPMSAETNELLSAFGSDALYTRLCKAQECFRARLSAKFWRCGADRPPSRFPWADADKEAEYRRWEQEYHERANAYATCQLVQSLGNPTIHDAVQPILESHDGLTIRDGAPLA
jgi:hypothetical protein